MDDCSPARMPRATRTLYGGRAALLLGTVRGKTGDGASQTSALSAMMLAASLLGALLLVLPVEAQFIRPALPLLAPAPLLRALSPLARGSAAHPCARLCRSPVAPPACRCQLFDPCTRTHCPSGARCVNVQGRRGLEAECKPSGINSRRRLRHRGSSSSHYEDSGTRQAPVRRRTRIRPDARDLPRRNRDSLRRGAVDAYLDKSSPRRRNLDRQPASLTRTHLHSSDRYQQGILADAYVDRRRPHQEPLDAADLTRLESSRVGWSGAEDNRGNRDIVISLQPRGHAGNIVIPLDSSSSRHPASDPHVW